MNKFIRALLVSVSIIVFLFSVRNVVQAADTTIYYTEDATPRIAYSSGMVNMHIDQNGIWQSDSDGVSGPDLDKLAYCQKYFPGTIRVEPSYDQETIHYWKKVNLNEQNDNIITVTPDRCVQNLFNTDPTPRIAFWGGKVNQHISKTSNQWETDPDGTSGANLDRVQYCNKWYPGTTSTKDYKTETLDGWRRAGNVGRMYTLAVTTIQCVQGVVDIQTTNSCSVNNNATPYLTVLSPNGGEVYQIGQEINVTWTCNLPSKYNKVDILFEAYNDSNTMGYGMDATNPYPTANDGQETITIPKNFFTNYANTYPNALTSWEGKRYTIAIIANDFITGSGTKPVGGSSNNFFTIQSTPPPIPTECKINSFTADPATINSGGTTKLIYSMSEGCRKFSIPELNYASLGVGGYQQIGPIYQSTSYTLKASSNEGCNGMNVYSDYDGQRCSYQTKVTTVNIQPIATHECSTPPFTKTLRFGMRNDQVEALQVILNDKGYLDDSMVTGYFGAKTRVALRAFQRDMGLLVTGYTGSTTRAKLNELWTAQCILDQAQS